jgi:hypothetical protein
VHIYTVDDNNTFNSVVLDNGMTLPQCLSAKERYAREIVTIEPVIETVVITRSGRLRIYEPASPTIQWLLNRCTEAEAHADLKELTRLKHAISQTARYDAVKKGLRLPYLWNDDGIVYANLETTVPTTFPITIEHGILRLRWPKMRIGQKPGLETMTERHLDVLGPVIAIADARNAGDCLRQYTVHTHTRGHPVYIENGTLCLGVKY